MYKSNGCVGIRWFKPDQQLNEKSKRRRKVSLVFFLLVRRLTTS